MGTLQLEQRKPIEFSATRRGGVSPAVPTTAQLNNSISMAETKNRPGRSTSLQRMLDLERLYISRPQTERHHPPPIQPKSKSQTTPILVTAHQTSPDHTRNLAPRLEGHAQRPVRSRVPRRGDTSCPPQLRPVVINTKTDTSLTMSRSDKLDNGTREFLVGDTRNSSATTVRDKYVTLVAYETPPKEVARCHSPSWEAYERRKIEKKMEKKERGESKKDGARRLSKKPPPASSPKSLQHALAAEADAGRGRGRERTEKTASASGSSQEKKAARKTRSRSGSFVSMLRAPFEFRRSSTDQATDSGFIGGIKLDLQRYNRQQQNLDSNAVEDESNIHPALRSNNLESPPALAVRPVTSSRAEQRRYPPITGGNNYHQKTASLTTSPASPAIPDVSKVGKWRTKFSRAGSRTRSLVGADEESQPRGSGDQFDGRRQPDHLPLIIKGPIEQPNTPSSSLLPPKPPHVASALGYSTSAQLAQPMTPSENRRAQKHSNNESVSSTSSAATGYNTAPSSPHPPEPPQRSPKRHSVFSSVDINPVPTLPRHKQHDSDTQAPTKAAQPSTQRSFPLCRNVTKSEGRQSRRASTGVATSSSTAASQISPYLSSPANNRNLPASSSEESCDDDVHSSASVSTPATSRPQSEREMPLTSGEEDLPSVHDAVKACLSKTYPLTSADNSEDEGGVDPIQAAADKVLAVFNEIPVQKPDLGRRFLSQASLSTATSFEPPAAERPLNLGRKPKSRVVQNSPPASSLERACQHAPAGAPIHATPVILQQDRPNAANDDVKPALKPALAVNNSVRRHLRHKSTPHLATRDRDPIAKVFVQCCSCTHYHDMPSNLFKAMSNPEGVFSPADKCGYSGALSMTVRCSWCKHEMSVRCCSALSTVVYIQERLR
ncbi:hypothetical protein E4U22_001244 [Claviceps purpurea]|nr:hypothetical protein E4U12_006339 [Claviceps purpurea]KAG6140491.1 hypothetical protein E4U28_003430 [Claviceps purpurea]KAG6196549.1 hypothetical protein E4U35_007863 [Claviceps purpurea]KAG6197499.1 hypothetical protein E4U50_007909 [Claviceps purpurea]KAG6208901.1 hypothetical protein E4U34_007751 [Claviceps purpurea]